MQTYHRHKQTCSQLNNHPIEQLPGLSQEDTTLLMEHGIKTTCQLLQQGSNQSQRHALAAELQIHIQYVNKWVALADLSRVPSVSCQYCGLLLHAGIGSVAQLAQTPLHKLHPQILRLQVATLQRRDLCPPVERVQIWIQQAQALVRLDSADSAASREQRRKGC